MKKVIIFMMVLLPFMLMAKAKFYKGSIRLNDEKIIKAYIAEPVGNANRLNYRYSEEGNTEKIDIEEVKSFEYYDDDNQLIVFHTMILGNPKTLRPSKVNISKNKYWAKLLREGKINLYEVYTEIYTGRSFSSNYSYYIIDENDTYGRFLFSPMNDVFKRIKYKYAGLDYYLKLYYETKCPEFVKSVKYEDLDKYGIGRIVDLYEEHCGN